MGIAVNDEVSVKATRELIALFEIDNDNRQAAWHQRLIACLPHAVFSAAQPQIIFNPSGMTYYNLKLDENNRKNDNSEPGYHIPELIDTFLIHEGVGIAINADRPKHAIDLSYGDIVGFHLYRSFAEPDAHPFKSDKPRAHLISHDDDILVKEVPEQVLPSASIKLLTAIMQHYGINSPQIKLIYLKESEQHELVFSYDAEQLEIDKSQQLLQKLGWFLPRYYTYCACNLNKTP